LHARVLEALRAAGMPAWSFPPSAQVVAQAGQVHTWDLTPLRQALATGLVPVVYGDTVLDCAWGATRCWTAPGAGSSCPPRTCSWP